MSTGIAFAIVVTAIGIAVVALIVVADLRGRTDDAPLLHLLQPNGRVAHHRARQLPPMWLHAAPRERFSAPQAHREMQIHIDCLTHECPRKMSAYKVLVDGGHLNPPRVRVRAR